MHKKKIESICLLGFIIFLSLHTLAQDSDNLDFQNNKDKIKKFEIGGQITALQFTDFDVTEEIRRREGFITVARKKQTDYGFGGRLAYNFNKNIAVEAEVNFFPVNKQRRIINSIVQGFFFPGGKKFQMVAGPKIGIRKKNFGVFGKVRPGLVSMDGYGIIIGIGNPIPTPTGGTFTPTISTDVGATFFAADVGGVVEFYPSKRTILRFDVGDTIIRYNAQEPKNINPSFTRHNLQTSVGFGFRF